MKTIDAKEIKSRCGTCKYHEIIDCIDDGYSCTNPDSEFFLDTTEATEVCVEYKDRGWE